MSKKFTIYKEEKEDLFKEFSKADIRFSNTVQLIQFHQYEYEKTKSDYNLNMIEKYNVVLKDIIKERADILYQLIDGYYNYNLLNNGDLMYYYSFSGKELTIY